MKLGLSMIVMMMMISSVSQKERIVGGDEAKRGMFPYIAGIETEIETFYGLRTAECTGTIIAARWILTAGHCLKIEHYITTRVRYTVGEINILRNLKPALRYVVHPNYSFERTYVLFIPTDVVHDDIGLIKTKEEIQFDKFITNVCISSNDQLSANPVCFVAGFGKLVDPLEVTYEKSYLLHFATLDYTEERPIIPNTIELSVKGKYPSLGDSGGPLMCDGKQIGIFSKVGASLNQAKLTYTQCGKYKNWIESITGTKVLDTCKNIHYKIPDEIGNAVRKFSKCSPFLQTCIVIFLLAFS